MNNLGTNIMLGIAALFTAAVLLLLFDSQSKAQTTQLITIEKPEVVTYLDQDSPEAKIPESLLSQLEEAKTASL